MIKVWIQQRWPVHLITICIIVSGGREGVTMLIGVHQDGQRLLTDIIDARRLSSFFLCRRQRWKQQRREYGDDGDDDQKLDQGEALPPSVRGFLRAPIISPGSCHKPGTLSSEAP